LDEARQRIGSLFESREDAGQVGDDAATDSTIDALLEKASAKLDNAGEEDRAEIIDLIETIRDARTSGDDAALDDGRQQLEDLLFYLET
jgi:hypothetical protein